MVTGSGKTLSDFQDKWTVLVGKAFNDFSSLPREERVWFTVEALIGDVDGGGLISHYYNSGADFNKETIEDLNYLGFPDISNLLLEINQFFPKGIVPLDLEERNNIINSWQGEKCDDVFLDKSDAIFYNREDELERKLIEHIETHRL
jgi:hypothetical protein